MSQAGTSSGLRHRTCSFFLSCCPSVGRCLYSKHPVLRLWRIKRKVSPFQEREAPSKCLHLGGEVHGAVIITKNLTDKVISHLLEVWEKVILHLSCTGYGGTAVEPNIPTPLVQIRQIEQLLAKGSLLSHVVIRVDPIIPTEKGLARAKSVMQMFAESGYKRFRVSLLDAYPHVRKRFQAAGLPLPYGDGFSPSKSQFDAANKMLAELKAAYPGIQVESCAEGKLVEAEAKGCVSSTDLKILGLPTENADSEGYQRSGCLCYSAKTELLKEKHQCPYKCLYCYWHN